MPFNRGDLVTVALQGDLGKPRPALVIQSDFFVDHPSTVILPITSDIRQAPLFRIDVAPTPVNGLKRLSQVMADKPQSIARERLRARIGCLNREQMIAVERALALFLGIA